VQTAYEAAVEPGDTEAGAFNEACGHSHAEEVGLRIVVYCVRGRLTLLVRQGEVGQVGKTEITSVIGEANAAGLSMDSTDKTAGRVSFIVVGSPISQGKKQLFKGHVDLR
jgi:hypothetical protein